MTRSSPPISITPRAGSAAVCVMSGKVGAGVARGKPAADHAGRQPAGNIQDCAQGQPPARPAKRTAAILAPVGNPPAGEALPGSMGQPPACGTVGLHGHLTILCAFNPLLTAVLHKARTRRTQKGYRHDNRAADDVLRPGLSREPAGSQELDRGYCAWRRRLRAYHHECRWPDRRNGERQQHDAAWEGVHHLHRHAGCCGRRRRLPGADGMRWRWRYLRARRDIERWEHPGRGERRARHTAGGR